MIGAGIAFAGGMLATAAVATDRGPGAELRSLVLLVVTIVVTGVLAAVARG